MSSLRSMSRGRFQGEVLGGDFRGRFQGEISGGALGEGRSKKEVSGGVFSY